MDLGNDESKHKLEEYLINFETTQRRLKGRLQMSTKDTPYQEKYSHIEMSKQSQLLLEYVEYVRAYYPHILQDMQLQKLIDQINRYGDLTDADKIKLYKNILKIHRQNTKTAKVYHVNDKA